LKKGGKGGVLENRRGVGIQESRKEEEQTHGFRGGGKETVKPSGLPLQEYPARWRKKRKKEKALQLGET